MTIDTDIDLPITVTGVDSYGDLTVRFGRGTVCIDYNHADAGSLLHTSDLIVFDDPAGALRLARQLIAAALVAMQRD